MPTLSTFSSRTHPNNISTQARANDAVSANGSPLDVDPVCLQQIPFPILVQAVADLLTALGYQDVQIMKPTPRKGRNVCGGLDIRAKLPTKLTHALVIVQVKQYTRPLPRAFIDELRGAMLRTGAGHGILVTTALFSPAAVEATQAAQHCAPVRLIDGEELVTLLSAPEPVNHELRQSVRSFLQAVPHAPQASAAEVRPEKKKTGGIRTSTLLSDVPHEEITVRISLELLIKEGSTSFLTPKI